jgi:hypothetical protein
LKQRGAKNLFLDEFNLYKLILIELGMLENEIEKDWFAENYLSSMIDVLTITSTILIVDDLDTLEEETQRTIFYNLTGMFSGLSARTRNPSRCLVTARLRLGAAQSQYHELRGFDEDEFYSYLSSQYKVFNMNLNFKKDSGLFRKFHKYSGGSPLFANSILRLLQSGFALDQALNNWQGAEGKEVREFAFKREIDTLTQSQLRTLYSVIKLSPCSFVEIKSVTDANEQALMADVAKLTDFHLLSKDGGVPSGGREFGLPSNAGILISLVEEKIYDPKRIEKKCKEIRIEKAGNREQVASIIGRVVAFWREENHEAAFKILDHEFRKGNQVDFDRDLECLYGRAQLRISPQNLNGADLAFERAYRKDCQRPELMDLWIEARQLKGDWFGVIHLCELSLKGKLSARRFIDIGNCYLSHGNEQLKNQSASEAVSTFVKGGRYLNNAIAENNLGDEFVEINSLRKQCFVEAVSLASFIYSAKSEIIYVWETAWAGF